MKTFNFNNNNNIISNNKTTFFELKCFTALHHLSQNLLKIFFKGDLKEDRETKFEWGP